MGDPRRPFACSTDRSRRSVLIELAAIAVGERLRLKLDRDKVAEIADSMSNLDLQSPILVGLDPSDSGLYPLITGSHRLEATHLLGWTSIETFVIDRNAEERLLIEIDENFARAELTALDRGRFAAKRKSLYEQIYGSAHGGDRRSEAARRDQRLRIRSWSFLDDTMAQTDLSKAAVHRAVKIGEGIPDGLAQALARTPIASQEGDLYRIAGMTPSQQRDLEANLAARTEPPHQSRGPERR